MEQGDLGTRTRRLRGYRVRTFMVKEGGRKKKNVEEGKSLSIAPQKLYKKLNNRRLKD